MSSKSGLQVNKLDNVATLFANDINSGDEVQILNETGESASIHSNDSIPYGHKIALRDIDIGEPVIKYGEKIGLATIQIKQGDHVHVHNLESDRGRGDR